MADYVTWSALASRAPRVRGDVAKRQFPLPWGVCVHTTGSGVLARANERSIPPLQAALEIYLAPDQPAEGIYTPFPHYVIGPGGPPEIVQICDEALRARHVLVTPDDRQAYLSGAWTERVAAAGLARWRARWAGVVSPSHLYPTASANESYVGVELIPLAQSDGSGSLFTAAQYDALASLLEDVEDRYQIRIEGKRLVGHEDVSPLTRWDHEGRGWDPGALRDVPTFHWSEVKRLDGFSFRGPPVA